MVRRFVAYAAATTFWLSAPLVAHAEPEASKSQSAEGASYRTSIHSAIDEFDHGNFAEAREHFARAHALFPNARTLRGLGMSEFELRNYLDAVQRLEEALSCDERRLEGKLREETIALLKRASAYVGQAHLRLSPASTAVHVDGFPSQLGPGNYLRLTVGDHVLEFSAEGRLSERRAVKIRGEQSVELTVTLVAPLTADSAHVAQAPVSLHDDGSKDVETPVYKRWWLWTGLGAVVAGGVAAGVILSLRNTHGANPNGGSTGDTLFVK
jgi:hypothetical protein